MPMRLRLPAIVLACILPLAPLSAELSVREWTNDAAALAANVLGPLTERFKQENCREELDYYVGAYLDALQALRPKIASKSYLLFREIGLVTAQDIAPFADRITCAQVDRWSFFQKHIKNKIEYTGNVLSILE